LLGVECNNVAGQCKRIGEGDGESSVSGGIGTKPVIHMRYMDLEAQCGRQRMKYMQKADTVRPAADTYHQR
jgi:hypothetical protein